MPVVKTSVKGQVTVPAEIRRKYHITKGTIVRVDDEDGVITIRPLLRDALAHASRTLRRSG